MTLKIDSQVLTPLERVLAWLLAQGEGEPDGRLVCPDHRVEHTGKNANVAILACALARLGSSEGDHLFHAARDIARRNAQTHAFALRATKCGARLRFPADRTVTASRSL